MTPSTQPEIERKYELPEGAEWALKVDAADAKGRTYAAVFGDGELAARLPSVLGALTTMLALGWIAWQFYGPTTAVLFALVFPSSIAVLVFARAATPDMLFTGTLALSLAAARRLGPFTCRRWALCSGNPPTQPRWTILSWPMRSAISAPMRTSR